MTDIRLTKFFSVFSKSVQDEILGFCKRISSTKADVYIFLARKAAVFCDCLEELGQIHLDGYVTTDRSLDIDGKWLKGKDVVIIDDAVVSGTTIYSLIQKLKQFGVNSITIQVLTINTRWFNSSLLESEEGESYLYPVYNKLPDNLCIKLCNDIVQAISLVPRPYDIDFPLFKSFSIPDSDLNQMIVLNNWYAHDIRTERQKDNNIINVSLIPNKQELRALSSAMGLDISRDCIVKIRIYGRLVDKSKQTFSIRVSPMIIFNEMDINKVRSIFDRIVANNENRDMFYNWSSTSQLRFLQFYFSNQLAMIWFNQIRHYVSLPEKLVYSYRNLSFLFPEELILPIESICSAFVKMPPALNNNNSSMHRSRNPISVYQSKDPISINARLYEPFLDMYHEKELPCRELVLKEGKQVFNIPEYKHIVNRLNEGLSFQDLTERLGDCIYDYDVEQKVSEFIDRSIDAGMIVPIIQQEGQSVFRAYRHGEDVLFGNREELMYRKMLSLFAEQSGTTKGITRIEIEKLIVLFSKIGIKEQVLTPYTSNFSSEPLDKNGCPMKILRVKPYLKGPISLLGTARQHQASKNIPYITRERKALWFTNVLIQNGSITKRAGGKKYNIQKINDATEKDFSLLTEKEQTFVQNFAELTGMISNPNYDTGVSFSDTDWARIAVTLTLNDTVTAVAAEMEIFYNDFDDFGITSFSGDASKDYSDIKHFVNSHMYESVHSAVMKIESYTEKRGQKLISSVHFSSNLEQRTWRGYFSDELNQNNDETNSFLQGVFFEQKVWAYFFQGVVNAMYLLIMARYKKHYQIREKDEARTREANNRMLYSFEKLEELRKLFSSSNSNAYNLFMEYDRIVPKISQLSSCSEEESFELLCYFMSIVTEMDEIVENIKETVCDILGERGKVYDIIRYNYAVHINLDTIPDYQRNLVQDIISRAYRKEQDEIKAEQEYAVSKAQPKPQKGIAQLPQKFKPVPNNEKNTPGIWYIAYGPNIARQVARFAMNVVVMLNNEKIDCRVTVFDRINYDNCITSNNSQNAEYHCNKFNNLMEIFKEKVLFPAVSPHSSSLIHICADSSKKEPTIIKDVQAAKIGNVSSFKQKDIFKICGNSAIFKTEYLVTEFDCIMERKTNMNKDPLLGINRDLYYWAETSPLYKKAVGFADIHLEDLSHALGPNETRCYKSTFNLMKAIWVNHPNLGLAPDYKLLAEKEYSNSYHSKYRDHLTHMFKVFLLGLYLYEKHSQIKNAINNSHWTDDDFLYIWIVTALYHDVGYLIETEEGSWDSDAGKEVLDRFNNSLKYPMAYLFPEKISLGREKALQEETGIIPTQVTGQTSIEKKLESFSGFGRSVRLSTLDEGNPIKTYYEYVCKKHMKRNYYDHGIVSACLLLFMNASVSDYMRKAEDIVSQMYSDQKALRDGYVKELPCTEKYITAAARAIAIHNLKKNWGEEEASELNRNNVTIEDFLIPLNTEPLAYLLRLCDELQCWDRRYSTSPISSDYTPISPELIRIYHTDAGKVNLSIEDKAIETTIATALEKLIDPKFSECIDLV